MQSPRNSRLNIRWTELEMDLIIQAAAEIGITPTDFIRESTIKVAKKLLAGKRSTRQ